MQSAEQIKKLITQGEPLIRQFTIQYFSESYSQDPELMSLVLESCENPMYAGFNQHALRQAHRLIYTEEAVAQLVDTLSAIQADNQEAYVTKKEELEAYQWLLVHAPLALLEAYQAQIEALPQEHKEFIEERRTLSSLSSQDLWGKLQSLEQSKLSNGHYQIEKVSDECLVKELASRQELTNEKVPELLHMLHSEQEDLIQFAVEALVYIGTEEVVKRLQEEFAVQTVRYRLAASSILGRIKLAASETAILRLFPKEQDKAVQTNLAKGICQLLSLKGIPAVWKLVMEGYDRSKVDLGEYMYANYSLNELELPPELTAWKEQAEQKQLELESGAVLDENEQNEPTPFDLSLERMSASQSGAGTLVTGRKIGRNEPCPCGSGKKYKKCCGS